MKQKKDVARIFEQAILERAVNTEGTIWEVRCIASGLSKNRTFYSEETLKEAVGLFSGVPCYADHADGHRSVRDLVGWFEHPRFESGGIYAEFHALEAADWFLGPMKESYDRGKPDLIGFSINGNGARRADRIEGQLAYVIDKIKTIESVDGVVNPSAGGRIVKLVADTSSDEEAELMKLEEMTLDELKEARPDLYAQIVNMTTEDMTAKLAAVAETERKEQEEAKAREAADAEAFAKAKVDAEAKKKKEDGVKEDTLREQDNQVTEEFTKLREEMAQMREQTQIADSTAKLREHIDDSGLPQVLRDKLIRRFSGRVVTEDEIKAGIEDERDTLKSLQDERAASFPSITFGEDAKDRAVKALDGLLSGESVDGVPPARTLREAYAVWHQLPTWSEVDAHQILRESWGAKFTEGNERLREASGISSGSPSGFQQWAEVMSDRIHKRLLDLYRLPGLDDWRKVCSSIISVPDFKTQRRIRTGGYANFNTVAEAGNYITVTSPTDEESTYNVTKYGGIELLTLEAVANDDVGAIRRIPEQLARAAKRTLYEVVFDLIFKNPNVTYEAVALINSATHLNAVNASTVDADLSDANMSKAKRLLVQQTELNSNKPLGLSAKYLVIPAELEATAMRLKENEYAMSLLGNTEGGTVTSRERDINVHRNSFEYIRVPHWTDTGAWFVVGDPGSLPTIEVGFYLGRQEPELFVQDMPNVGSNFDQDVIKYKARLIFGAALLDHRAFVGSSQQTR